MGKPCIVFVHLEEMDDIFKFTFFFFFNPLMTLPFPFPETGGQWLCPS